MSTIIPLAQRARSQMGSPVLSLSTGGARKRYGSGMLGQNVATQVIPGYEDKLVVTMDEPKTKACRASKGQRLN